MKKFFSLITIIAMLAAMTAAYAEDLGVQVIGGKNGATDVSSIDDMKIGSAYTLDGYAKVLPAEYLVVDYFGQFNKDADYNSTDDHYTKCNLEKPSNVYYQEDANYFHFYTQATWQDSGLNAEFMWLKMDVTNLQMNPISFMENITVKVVYADEYEFAGWVRQINYDHNTNCFRFGATTPGGGTVVMHPENEEPIDMMYTGTYIFGCTLPNSVIEDKSSPLRVEINLGGNELTYHIRK